MGDLEDFLSDEGEQGKSLYRNIIKNTKRYIKILVGIANGMEDIKRTTPLTDEEEFMEALRESRL